MALDFNVNLLAVLIAGIAGMVVGWLWYGPLFGKVWMKLSNMSKKDMDVAKKKGMGKLYLAALIATLISSYVLALFIGTVGTGLNSALLVAFFVWLGFIATIQLSPVLWQNQPVSLFILNAAYYLVSYEVMAIILSLW